MTSPSSNIVTLDLRCFCGAQSHSLPLSTSSLPLHSNFCNCNSCRHGSGAPAVAAAGLPSSELPSFASDSLAKYAFSPRANVYFCGTCGTWMLWHSEVFKYLCVFLGCIEGGVREGGAEVSMKELVAIKSHMFIEDSKDGGFSEWLKEDDQGVVFERWLKMEGGEKCPLGWTSASTEASGGADEDILRFHCLCNGVDLRITRPNKETESFIDSALDQSSHWPLDATHTKYQSHTCVCADCRRAVGTEVAGYIAVPFCNLFLSSGSASSATTTRATDTQPPTGLQPLPKDLNFGTLRHVRLPRADATATRSFCGTCGAFIMWLGDLGPGSSGVPHLAFGCLEAPEGVRADKWVEWIRGEAADAVGFSKEGLKRGTVTKGLCKAMGY